MDPVQELQEKAAIPEHLKRTPSWAAPVLCCAAAAVLLFWLPLHVPVPFRATISASYIAGYNNAFAVRMAACFSLGVLLLTWYIRRKQLPLPAEPVRLQERLGIKLVAAVVASTALILGIAGALVAWSGMRYLSDAGYLIEQAVVRHDTGRALYSQIEFAYGPLLLLPTVWLSYLLRSTVTTAYYVSLVIQASLGLLLLAFILNELPIRGGLRRKAYLLFAVGALTPFLGVNYTYLRFGTPIAVLLFATRQRSPWICAGLLAAGQALVLLISPELGLATLAAICVFALIRAGQSGWQWLLAGLVPFGTCALVIASLGEAFLMAIRHFSRGSLNLPVGPYPHLLIFLFALVWLVPAGLGRLIDLHDSGSARLLAVYTFGLASLPAALGRCDPLHVFFNGTAILVLALVVVSRSGTRPGKIWIASFAVLVLWEHVVNDRTYEYRTAYVLKVTVLPYLPSKVLMPALSLLERGRKDFARTLRPNVMLEHPVDPAILNSIAGAEGIATPLEIRPCVEDLLRSTHRYRPGYRAFWVNTFDPESEDRAIDDLNRNRWALLPLAWGGSFIETPANIRQIQVLPMPYRWRHAIPYYGGEAFRNNLVQHWTPIYSFGLEVLWRKKDQVGGA